MSEKNINRIISKTLDDIEVELMEEFDRNFERKAFFTKAWQRRSGSYRHGKTLLTDTGNLRRSTRSEKTANSVVFKSNALYASIHNHGGEITVTRKMKRYFWYKYAEATGGFGYTKKGTKRNVLRNKTLTSAALFY